MIKSSYFIATQILLEHFENKKIVCVLSKQCESINIPCQFNKSSQADRGACFDWTPRRKFESNS